MQNALFMIYIKQVSDILDVNMKLIIEGKSHKLADFLGKFQLRMDHELISKVLNSSALTSHIGGPSSIPG